jgi:hypothetical protein
MDVDSKRILVIANETVEDGALHETIRSRARGAGAVEVLVIAPALNSRLRHWLSDHDLARRRAELRLARSIERLAADGVEAEGLVGDGDPLQAIADGLRVFPADEIVIATHPQGRSHWLARNLVERARANWTQPVAHVVVDPAAGREHVAA